MSFFSKTFKKVKKGLKTVVTSDLGKVVATGALLYGGYQLLGGAEGIADKYQSTKSGLKTVGNVVFPDAGPAGSATNQNRPIILTTAAAAPASCASAGDLFSFPEYVVTVGALWGCYYLYQWARSYAARK